MSYIGGPLPGQEDKEIDWNEERLLGSRVSEQVYKVMAALPKDKPWLNKVGKGLEWFADNSWHEGWIKAEEALIEKVGEYAPKIGIDSLVAQMGVGILIPGPGEARTAKRVVKTNHLMLNVTEDMTQALRNPNYKNLTREEMLKGLTGDMREAGVKRLNQIELAQTKKTQALEARTATLKARKEYDAIHGRGAYLKREKELLKNKEIRRLETTKKREQRVKVTTKAERELWQRDLNNPRSEYLDLELQEYGARHHKSGVNTGDPMFRNLSFADGVKLHTYAKKFKTEFGDVLNNLIDVPGDIRHELGNIHNAKLHVWLKKHGLDTPPVISPDAGVEVRMRVMQNYIVDLRKQSIKLKELMGGPRGTANVEDLTFIKPPLTKKDLGIN